MEKRGDGGMERQIVDFASFCVLATLAHFIYIHQTTSRRIYGHTFHNASADVQCATPCEH
jgi:hypothetical protein